MIHTPDTEPFVLEVPVLEDEAVDTLHTFLLYLLTQFENHYFAQLHRYQQDMDKLRRGVLEERHASTRPDRPPSDTHHDLDFNDETPF
jgi:hypothetical protein